MPSSYTLTSTDYTGQLNDCMQLSSNIYSLDWPPSSPRRSKVSSRRRPRKLLREFERATKFESVDDEMHMYVRLPVPHHGRDSLACLTVNGEELGKGTASLKSVAKNLASKEALTKLKSRDNRDKVVWNLTRPLDRIERSLFPPYRPLVRSRPWSPIYLKITCNFVKIMNEGVLARILCPIGDKLMVTA